MPRFTALICAYQDRDDAAGELRAALPLAGRTLLERQARVAIAAGVGTILVVTDLSAPGIDAAVGRLRGDGLVVQVVRNAGEAARAVEADERLLLMGGGALDDEEEVARLNEAEGYAVLTVAESGHDERFERIDAEARWSGFAIIDGRLLRNTAPMLDEWDLQSTLLRRAIQEGARQMRVTAESEAVMAHTPADLATLEANILRGSAGFQRDWVSRYLLSPLEAEATRRLMGGAVTPLHLHGASLGLKLLSAACFLFGWLWPALILFLLSTPLTGVGERLGRLTGVDHFGTRVRQALPLGAGLALLSLGQALARNDGWGALVLGAGTIAFAAALEGERPRRTGIGLFLAEPKGMAWLMLPFAAVGQWTLGLGGLFSYAALSFFVAQRQAHGPYRND